MPAFRHRCAGRYETLTRALSDRADAPELAAAFGQYGMVLQAAEFYDVAEPCYLNAQKLAPDEVRWPYYLAGLYKSRGETDKAEAAYKQALALRPDDLADARSGSAGCISIRAAPRPPSRCSPRRSPSRRARSRCWPGSAAWPWPSATTRRP